MFRIIITYTMFSQEEPEINGLVQLNKQRIYFFINYKEQI